MLENCKINSFKFIYMHCFVYGCFDTQVKVSARNYIILLNFH